MSDQTLEVDLENGRVRPRGTEGRTKEQEPEAPVTGQELHSA